MTLDIASTMAQTNNLGQQARVPAFLNKLHALVNDPETDEYVRWNHTGTSFVIPNSQLMAANVLPRSFKTINFNSFVRQLNMYGFHKVPHLNDGALHTENAPETWEFMNEHFTRDHPDLPSIVRKKLDSEKARSSKRQGSPDMRPRPSTYPAIEAAPNVAAPRDMSVVYDEIRNIKRLQNSVIGELKRLKTDNEGLWTEAAEARARHDQQQATINKMLKFLSTVFSPTKSNTIPTRNRGLLTGPSAFEELGDDSVDLSSDVLTPEAQETGARELSNLFGGAQPILPINAGDANWWQNLVKTGNDNGMFNLPPSSYVPQTDDVAPYNTTQSSWDQHRNSLAAMEHAVNQTDQSIGRISNVLGVNDWDNFNFGNYQNIDANVPFEPVLDTQNINPQPEYRFEDFIRNTDENGTILDQNQDTMQPESTDARFQSLSREASPKRATTAQSEIKEDNGKRKRTRSQTSVVGASPLKRTR